ncbi:hypothetical protein [Pararobbsia silviterrae]|uniref:hypothetical protein n=1 Tax=Pararobbsia silviterrae TaxID=1792498 RepID=UPI001314047F|nr:hypothetical protein [Pararobbsia silviterrae]
MKTIYLARESDRKIVADIDRKTAAAPPGSVVLLTNIEYAIAQELIPLQLSDEEAKEK